MKRSPLYLSLLLSIIFSCTEKEATTPKKNIHEKLLPTVATQNYETALFDLMINADTLLHKGIAAYSAVQVFDKKQPARHYFHSFSNQQGTFKYCELLGKDTLISERIIASNAKQITTEKKWRQINRKILLTTINNEQNEIIFLIEKEKNKPADTTKFGWIKDKLSFIAYPSKDIEFFDYSQINLTQVTYKKKNNDTLFQYQIIENNGRTVAKKFINGLSHSYSYSFNALGQLTEITWKENNKKVNAGILFQYDKSGLPSKRIVKSTISAFGNSVTTFQYK